MRNFSFILKASLRYEREGGEKMEDLRTALTADIESFARRVLSGSGTPQEVTALPSLLMWHSGVNPPQELPQERP